MLKWYEEVGENSDVVISSRVRLARNLNRYPFSTILTDEQAINLVEEVNHVMKDYVDEEGSFTLCNLNVLSDIDKAAMVERHIISPVMAAKKQSTGLVLAESESTGIMINEEDHIRIQSIMGGMNIDKALRIANEIDDMTYDKLEYAFDERYGYLTSCPTNVGTGLRASYMVFLPALAASGKIVRLANEVSKYGVALRGIYGEGTEGTANIYQISNQKTLGNSEADIINNLNGIVEQVIKQERKRREFILTTNYDAIEDQVYRSYGVLRYTKQMNTTDTMTLLSQLKFGLDMGVIEFEEELNIYSMMMAIQPANIQYRLGKTAGSKVRDKVRAEYINQYLPDLKK